MAAAQLFAARGGLVDCAGRQESKLAQTRALIEAAGGLARIAAGDVSREKSVAALPKAEDILAAIEARLRAAQV